MRGTSRLSLDIMKATGGRFSHVAIAVSEMPAAKPHGIDGIVIEALIPRVVTRPFHFTVAEASYWEVWSNRTLADYQRWAIVEAACVYSAENYGYGKILEQGLDAAFRTALFTNEMPQVRGCPICSMLACLSYNDAGLRLGPMGARSIAPSRPAPFAGIAEFVAASADYQRVAFGAGGAA